MALLPTTNTQQRQKYRCRRVWACGDDGRTIGLILGLGLLMSASLVDWPRSGWATKADTASRTDLM